MNNRSGDGSEPAYPALVFGLPPYEAIDHTADLALIVRGRSSEELFVNAALGMFAFLIDPGQVEPREEHRVEATGHDLEECLVAFLQEVLFLEEVHRVLFCRFEVETATPPLVRARGWGERFDPARHELLTDIKAATYHALEIRKEETPGGTIYIAQIVLDI